MFSPNHLEWESLAITLLMSEGLSLGWVLLEHLQISVKAFSPSLVGHVEMVPGGIPLARALGGFCVWRFL